MKKYLIRSGGFETIVEASSAESALDNAMEEWLSGGGDALGLLMSIIQVADGEKAYVATESIAWRAGVDLTKAQETK